MNHRFGFVFAVVILGVAIGHPQRTPGGRGAPPKPKSDVQRTNWATTIKEAGFDVILPDRGAFNEMMGTVAPITAALSPKVQGKHNVIAFECGFKKGGVVELYEAEVIPGVDPKKFFEKVQKLGIVKDHQYMKTWSMVVVPNKKLMVAVSGTTTECRDVMVKTMQLPLAK